MAEKSPYEIKVYVGQFGDLVGEVWYKGEFVKKQEFVSYYKPSIDGVQYSGTEGVKKSFEFDIKVSGFFENGKAYPPFKPEEPEPEVPEFEAKQKELFNQTGELGDKIPGLDKDKIIEELAKKEPTIKQSVGQIRQSANENVELGMSEEEAAKKAEDEIKKMTDGYKKNLEGFVNTRIVEINQQYTVFKKSVESIPPDVSGAITNIALPPTISAPPAAPNPAYAITLTKQIKNALSITLSAAIAAFAIVLKLCTELKFKLPDSILAVFDKLKNFGKLLDTIPV